MNYINILKNIIKDMGFVNVLDDLTPRAGLNDDVALTARNIPECDLKRLLTIYSEVFVDLKNISIEKLGSVQLAYIKIYTLVSDNRSDIDYKIGTEIVHIIKERISNFDENIRLLSNYVVSGNDKDGQSFEEVNRKNKIEKNESLKKIYETEIDNIEADLPVLKERYKDIKESVIDEPEEHKTEEKEKAEEKDHKNILLTLSGKLENRSNKKLQDKILKEEQEKTSNTLLNEILYTEKKLKFNSCFTCKDFNEYSLMRFGNNRIAFGLSANIRGNSYINEDDSLLELIKADDIFLQLMSEDLTSDEYDLSSIDDDLKDSIRSYFNFVTYIFNTNIGKTLSVQEYLNFNAYYNKLSLLIFNYEKNKKEIFYRALRLANEYLEYLNMYDMKSDLDEKTVAYMIVNKDLEGIINKLKELETDYIVDQDAKDALDGLMEEINIFPDKKKKDEKDKKEDTYTESPKDISQNINLQPHMPFQAVPVIQQPMSFNNYGSFSQIVIQMFNKDTHAFMDEAVYVSSNLAKALEDYRSLHNVIKRFGIRANGQEIFNPEEIC